MLKEKKQEKSSTKGQYKNQNAKYKMLREKYTNNKEKDKCFSVRELAREITNNKQPSYYSRISQIELGDVRPSPADMKLYHKYFHVSYEYLMGDTDNMKFENYDIGNQLGLSDTAIEQLKFWKKRDENEDCIVDVLNSIFESGYAGEILKSLALYLFTEPQYFFPHAETIDEFLQTGRTWDDDDDAPQKIDVINSNGFHTTLSVKDLTQIYEKMFLENLQFMKSELKKMGKIPNIGRFTTWSLKPRKNDTNKDERRTNGKRTSKKKQRG